MYVFDWLILYINVLSRDHIINFDQRSILISTSSNRPFEVYKTTSTFNIL